jgi:hypothetical protein
MSEARRVRRGWPKGVPRTPQHEPLNENCPCRKCAQGREIVVLEDGIKAARVSRITS